MGILQGGTYMCLIFFALARRDATCNSKRGAFIFKAERQFSIKFYGRL